MVVPRGEDKREITIKLTQAPSMGARNVLKLDGGENSTCKYTKSHWILHPAR